MSEAAAAEVRPSISDCGELPESFERASSATQWVTALSARFVNAVRDALAVREVVPRAAGPGGHGLEARPRACATASGGALCWSGSSQGRQGLSSAALGARKDVQRKWLM